MLLFCPFSQQDRSNGSAEGKAQPQYVRRAGPAWIADRSIWRCFAIGKQDLQINEEIRDPQVRVIDVDGSQLGILALREALRIALDKNLDLVKIAPQAAPPVCRIMDYGKFRFEQSKRDKEARKNQKIVELKEIRLSMNIEQHDFDTKAGHAKRFLTEGDKVKVSIRFRGREMAHMDIGAATMRKFAETCSEFSVVEKMPSVDGRNMLMILAPKPSLKQQPAPKNAGPKKQEAAE